MVTLTETSIFWHKASEWFVFVILGFFILLTLVLSGRSLKNTFFPPGPLPATVAFGKLPKMQFALGTNPPAGIFYSIETISGDLPNNLPSTAKVFALMSSRSSFGDPERARQKAALLGFDSEPTQVSAGVFKFTDIKVTGRLLQIYGDNFEYTTDFFNDELVSKGRPEGNTEAINSAKSFFRKIGLALEDFADSKVSYWKVENGKLTEAVALAETNIIRVEFQRNDLDKLPVIPAKDKEAVARALVAKEGVVAASWDVLPIEKFKFATYPLKGIKKAFEDLKAGRGKFDREAPGGTVVIKDVILGYVEEQANNTYLQPVYIFQTASGINAYVPAIEDSWTQ